MSLLAEIALRSLIVGLAGTMLVAIGHRLSGAWRHALALGCLVGVLVSPIVVGLRPRLEVRITTPPLPSAKGSDRARPSPPLDKQVGAVSPVSSPGSPVPESVVPILIGLWALGVGALGVRLLAGCCAAWRLAHRTSPLQEEDNLGTGIKIRSTDEISTPLLVWAGQPVVLLPTSYVEWSDECRAAVIAHETAHARRGDWAWLVLSRLVVALHWPNPFAWALARSLRRAAEDAADDAVLRTGLPPAVYATHLLDLAQGRPSSSDLALSMAAKADVHRRVHHVLNPQRSRLYGGTSLVALAAAALLAPLVLFPVLRFRSDPLLAQEGEPVAGEKANGFVGRLSDGRKVEMVQIVERTGMGIVAWKPDGSAIVHPLPVPLSRKPGFRTIVLRLSSPVPDVWRGGSVLPGGPVGLVSGWGGDLAGRRSGERMTYNSLFGAAKAEVASLSFDLNDGPWLALPRASSTNIVVAPTDLAFARRTGESVSDPSRTTKVAYTALPEVSNRWIRIVAVRRDGRMLEPIRQSAGLRILVEFGAPREKIARFELQRRRVTHVEFLGVRLKPNMP